MEGDRGNEIGWWPWIFQWASDKTSDLEWFSATDTVDAVDSAPWQERLLIFILLCMMVAWLSKIAFAVRERWGLLGAGGYSRPRSDGNLVRLNDDDGSGGGLIGGGDVLEMMPLRRRSD